MGTSEVVHVYVLYLPFLMQIWLAIKWLNPAVLDAFLIQLTHADTVLYVILHVLLIVVYGHC